MNKISEILNQSINDLEDAVSPEEIDKIRIKYLGKKRLFRYQFNSSRKNSNIRAYLILISLLKCVKKTPLILLILPKQNV